MVSLVLGLALIGLALFLVEKFIPMDPIILIVIRVVVVIAVLYYVAQLMGFHDLALPRAR